MPKIVAVTGGAGYIGSHLVRQLLAADYQVRVVDSGIFGLDHLPGDSRLTLYPGTVLNLSTLNHAFHGADAVVHLAGLVGDPACNIDAKVTNIANIGGTRFVLTMAKYCNVPRLIFASSCSVYGNLADEGREDGPVNPVSLYARSKLQSELELMADPDLPVTILRFATIYGHSPRPRLDLVANLFTAQAVQEGAITVHGTYAWRPFVHVADVAGAIKAVIEAEAAPVLRQTFNVGDTNGNLTIGALGVAVQEIVEADYRPVTVTFEQAIEARNYRVSFDKITKAIGWKAERTLEQGIREMAHHAAIVPEFGGYGDYRQAKYHNHLAEVLLTDDTPVETVQS